MSDVSVRTSLHLSGDSHTIRSSLDSAITNGGHGRRKRVGGRASRKARPRSGDYRRAASHIRARLSSTHKDDDSIPSDSNNNNNNNNKPTMSKVEIHRRRMCAIMFVSCASTLEMEHLQAWERTDSSFAGGSDGSAVDDARHRSSTPGERSLDLLLQQIWRIGWHCSVAKGGDRVPRWVRAVIRDAAAARRRAERFSDGVSGGSVPRKDGGARVLRETRTILCGALEHGGGGKSLAIDLPRLVRHIKVESKGGPPQPHGGVPSCGGDGDNKPRVEMLGDLLSFLSTELCTPSIGRKVLRHRPRYLPNDETLASPGALSDFLTQVLGVRSPVLGLLRCSTQAALAPLLTAMRELLSPAETNSVRNSWHISIEIDWTSNVATLSHTKSERDTPASNDLYGEFTLCWTLHMRVDLTNLALDGLHVKLNNVEGGKKLSNHVKKAFARLGAQCASK